MKKFEDLKVGLTNKSRTSVVELEEMLDWAKKYDPQWFHADPEAAKTSIFGEIISSGIYTAALWRKLDHEINGDIDFICGVAWKETRWPASFLPCNTTDKINIAINFMIKFSPQCCGINSGGYYLSKNRCLRCFRICMKPLGIILFRPIEHFLKFHNGSSGFISKSNFKVFKFFHNKYEYIHA